MSTIHVARDFSSTPGGRTPEFGPASGQEFRKLLEQALESSDDEVSVILDGVEGYGSSFLEEAFGGLIRLGRWSPEEICRRVKPIAEDPEFRTYAIEAESYMTDASVGRR